MRRVIEFLAGGVMIVLAALGAISLKDGFLQEGRTFYIECGPPESSEGLVDG